MITFDTTSPPTLSANELLHEYALRVLAYYNGNKTHAARALGISRRALYRWVASPSHRRKHQP